MPTEVTKDIINLSKNSSFYNKIQITDTAKTTETFWFMDNGIAHAKVTENSEKVTADELVEEMVVIEKLTLIDNSFSIIIAGNTMESVLEYRF